jgi:hypothetical protein
VALQAALNPTGDAQPRVEVAEQLADRRVQLAQRQEVPIAQPRQDEPLDDQHRPLRLGLCHGSRRKRFGRTAVP